MCYVCYSSGVGIARSARLTRMHAKMLLLKISSFAHQAPLVLAAWSCVSVCAPHEQHDSDCQCRGDRGNDVEALFPLFIHNNFPSPITGYGYLPLSSPLIVSMPPLPHCHRSRHQYFPFLFSFVFVVDM